MYFKTEVVKFLIAKNFILIIGMEETERKNFIPTTPTPDDTINTS